MSLAALKLSDSIQQITKVVSLYQQSLELLVNSLEFATQEDSVAVQRLLANANRHTKLALEKFKKKSQKGE